MNNLDDLEKQLERSEEKARLIARALLQKVRKKLGFSINLNAYYFAVHTTCCWSLPTFKITRMGLGTMTRRVIFPG